MRPGRLAPPSACTKILNLIHDDYRHNLRSQPFHGNVSYSYFARTHSCIYESQGLLLSSHSLKLRFWLAATGAFWTVAPEHFSKRLKKSKHITS